MDMDLVVIMTGIITLAIGVPIVRAVARSIERRGLSSEDSREIRDRLQSIELAVDAIAVEVERIAEAQRFSTRLLAERPASPPAIESGRQGPANAGRLPDHRTPS
ncbi:MAG: hypothetical protein U0163_17425 [Gemmatimonadaceae bacterium]